MFSLAVFRVALLAVCRFYLIMINICISCDDYSFFNSCLWDASFHSLDGRDKTHVSNLLWSAATHPHNDESRNPLMTGPKQLKQLPQRGQPWTAMSSSGVGLNALNGLMSSRRPSNTGHFMILVHVYMYQQRCLYVKNGKSVPWRTEWEYRQPIFRPI